MRRNQSRSRQSAAAQTALTGRDKALILTLAATGVCTTTAVQQAHFRDVSYEVYRRHTARLVALGLVEQVWVDPRTLPDGQGRGRGRLLLLTDSGWQAAADWGAQVPPQAARRRALRVPEAAVAVADVYLLIADRLRTGAAQWWLWELPLRREKFREPPTDPWAGLAADNPQRLLVFDLDLPGRSLDQVLARLTTWWSTVRGEYDRTVKVCYVISDDERRQQIVAYVREHRNAVDWSWLDFRAPTTVARQFLDQDTGGG